MVAAIRFARAEVALVAALAVLTLGVMGFVEVADDMTEADGRMLDRIVLEAVRTPGDPSDPIGPKWFEIAMADLTSLGGVATLVAITLVVSGFLLIRRRFAAVVFLVTAELGGLFLSQTLKGLYGRERPPIDYRAVEAINPSFPSGHAMLSAVAFLTLGAILAQSLKRRREQVYVMAVAVLLTLVIGLSRVYLGVHWATDVMAGWCIGGAWAAAGWLVAWAHERFFGGRGVKTPHGHAPRIQAPKTTT